MKYLNSINQVFITWVLLAYTTWIFQTNNGMVEGKMIGRCEFAKHLIEQNIPYEDMDDFVCLATWGSGLNTSFVTPDNKVFGILSIECNNENSKDPISYCPGIKCSDLMNNDLEDDIKCGRMIKIQHSTFDYWPIWIDNCKNRNISNYIKDCLDEETALPQILTHPSQQNQIFYRNLKNQNLTCIVTGFPPPTVDWIYNYTLYPDAYEARDENSTVIRNRLIFPTANFSKDNETFTCFASNIVGQASSYFWIKIEDGDISGGKEEVGMIVRYEIAIPVSIIGVVLIVAISLSLYRKYLIKVYGLTKEEIEQFENGAPSKLAKFFCRGHQPTHFSPELFQFLPYDNRFEIKAGELIIKKNEILGSGHFGIVYKGEWKGSQVAVKTPKEQVDNTYIKTLLTELKIMIHIGKHPNIVNLIGAQTRALKKGQLHIAVEFCELGDLEMYLRNSKQYFLDPSLPSGYISGGDLTSEAKQVEPISFLDLITWSSQIAAGMVHLETKKVLHGDLATRNVLLFNKFTAKISDFGLSRQLYTQPNYVKQEDSPLPWRWMAIESLTCFSFCSKTDIWSFGVTLWEIFSLGDVPYPGLSWSQEFPNLLKNGMRLLKPEHASDQIYEIMKNCWNLDPDRRPDFVTLHDMLTEYRNDLQYPMWRINMVQEERESMA